MLVLWFSEAMLSKKIKAFKWRWSIRTSVDGPKSFVKKLMAVFGSRMAINSGEYTHFLFYCRIYSLSSYFTTKKAQHSTQHTQCTTTHAHTHAHLPLTVILRVVCVRGTRGKPAKIPEKGKVRGISGEGSFRANRSSAAKWRKTRTIW